MSTPPSEGLTPGSRFGVYEIGPCIGQGAMGQVYRAEHTLLKKPVALKIMATAARESTDGNRRFTREARAAATIKHPNVVDIVDMGVLEGQPFIVMELLEGEDLESYLRRHGTLSDRQLADLALPIIAALGAVHDAGVVHRDIKPSNIFLAKGAEEDLVPKVLDFGISKAAKGIADSQFVMTGPETLVGTPLYISPEALRGSKYLTAKSDQYSLGVVLYQCAVGRRPHEAKELGKLVRCILNDPVEPLRRLNPNVSPELEAAVLRALSRRPEDRFEHVRELGTALWALASKRTQHVWAKRFSDGTQSVGSSTLPLHARWNSRFARRLGVLSALAALLGGVGYYALSTSAWFRARARMGTSAPLSLAKPTASVVAPALRPRVPEPLEAARPTAPPEATGATATFTKVPTPTAPAPSAPAVSTAAPAVVPIVAVHGATAAAASTPSAVAAPPPARATTPRAPRRLPRAVPSTREPEPERPVPAASSELKPVPSPPKPIGANQSPILD